MSLLADRYTENEFFRDSVSNIAEMRRMIVNLHRLMTYSRKFFILMIAGLLVAGQFVLPGRVSAEENTASGGWPQEPEVLSASAVLMDLDSGEVLYSKDDKAARYPASTTKLMTALVALEHSKLDETVTFSSDAVFKNETNSSHIARDVGEQMSVEQTLYGILLASANECAYAIAEHAGANMGGDYHTFIQAMNDKAKELGCVNTHFTNSSGLHDDQHYTCAHDLALIARAAYQNETIRKMVGTRRYEIPPTNKHAEPTPLNNTHAMLSTSKTREFLYDGCLGGKTGYTDEARHTLVTYVDRNGGHLAGVSMCAEGNDSYKDTIALMDWAVTNFYKVSIQDAGLQAKVDEAIKTSGKSGLSWQAEGSLLLPKGVHTGDLSVRIEPTGSAQDSDPTDEGKREAGTDLAGRDKGEEETYRLTIFFGDRPLVSRPMAAAEKTGQNGESSGISETGKAIGNFFGNIGKVFRTIIGPILLAMILILVLLFVVFLFLTRRRRARRRARKNRVRKYRGRR